MTPEPSDIHDLALKVRAALEASDPTAFAELLDPQVTWGAPGAPTPACRNRSQVLAWYEKGRAAGTRAAVTDVAVAGDRLLVSLTVGGSDAARERGGAALRWQVLGVRGGHVVDIAGFDDRTDALAYAQSPVP
ncbi:MAG: nuclear transport factor 2 family protein [Acidimicrobiales bacterium]